MLHFEYMWIIFTGRTRAATVVAIMALSFHPAMMLGVLLHQNEKGGTGLDSLEQKMSLRCVQRPQPFS